MMLRRVLKSFRRDREGINDAVLYNCSLGGGFSSGDVQIR
jgi:hypothetical protein